MTAMPTNTAKQTAREYSMIDVLGVAISPADLDETVQTIESWRSRPGAGRYVCCVCVHGIVTAHHDPEVREALNGASLATKDGMPVAWWCQRSGFPNARRVCGTDLMSALCETGVATGARHYFYGSTPAVLERLTAQLQQRFPGLVIAGTYSPPFRQLSPEEQQAEIDMVNAARPDYVWVGLGMPKQEKWMARNACKINAAAMLGVGAAFDFHAGLKPRAPAWMQRSGLEWLFRLASEPRRLARRYIIDNWTFARLVACHLFINRARSAPPRIVH